MEKLSVAAAMELRSKN
ncbi:hypothetical protein L195_g055504, partial [Trifolium pratense]